jgi:hypothetical protein
MRAQDVIDFKKMDWSKVGREKAEFIYGEATDHNDRLIESINNLNGKAFSLLSIALPVLSAAAGFLLGIWGDAGKKPVAVILLFISLGLASAVLLLLIAVFPKNILLSTGTPASYFSGDFYKADMHHLFSYGIASLNKYIQHNLKIMKFRSRFLFAGTLFFIAAPIVTVAVFLTHLLSW